MLEEITKILFKNLCADTQFTFSEYFDAQPQGNLKDFGNYVGLYGFDGIKNVKKYACWNTVPENIKKYFDIRIESIW